jgi:hypothetical protein
MEDKIGHLANVRFHRKQSFSKVEIREFEVLLSAPVSTGRRNT